MYMEYADHVRRPLTDQYMGKGMVTIIYEFLW
jgi:hypothetical protein